MKLTVFSTQSYDRHFFDEINKKYKYEIVYLDLYLNAQTAKLASGSDAICSFVNDDIDKGVIKQLKKEGVRFIVLRCAGVNQVDLSAAADAGILVANVPAYSPEAVAEHAVAQLLTLNRKTHKAYNRVREGNFSLERLIGFNLFKKTVGVIGLGKIGLAFARIMHGFGCTVIGADPVAEKVPEYLKRVELDELFGKSDIISLHCPLIPDTRHIINRDTIKKMKKGVYLINTSRGGLIKTKDVIRGLKSAKIGALGIDVYEQEGELFFRDLSEKIIDDDDISRLMSFHNVLITAHQGFFTEEALTEIAAVTFRNLEQLNSGGECDNQVK